MKTAGGPQPGERDAGQDALFGLAKSLARHSGVYGAFDAVGRAGMFLLIPLYTRSLQADGYGTLELFTVSQSVLLIVAMLGLGSALVRYAAATEPGERRALFRAGFTVVAASAGVLALGTFLLARPLDRLVFPGEDVAAGWRLVALVVLAEAATQFCLALLRAREMPARYSGVILCRLAVTVAANLYLVAVLDRSVEGVLTGNLAGSAAALLVGLVLVREDLGFSLDRARMLRLLRFGLPLIGAGLAFFLINSSDRFFLKAFASLEELGIYSLGYKFGLAGTILVNAFVAAWPPILIRISREPEAPRILARIQSYFLLLGGLLVLGVSAFAGELIGLAAGADYLPAVRFVPPVLAASVLYGVFYIQSSGTLVRDRTRLVPGVVGLGAAVNLAGNALLVPRYGALAAAWTTFLAFAVMALHMGLIGRRLYPVALEPRLVRWALLTAAAGVGVALLTGPGATGILGRIVLVLGLYPAALYGLFLDSEERLRLRLLAARRLGRRT